MRRLSIVVLTLGLAGLLYGQPECNIDANPQISDGLLALVSGNVKGFQPGPVYVTITNGTRKFTTMAEKGGLWAAVYVNTEGNTDVLCWQPWRGNSIEVKGR